MTSSPTAQDKLGVLADWITTESGPVAVLKLCDEIAADLDRAEAKVKGMIEEGCTAVGVLENIFNGVTAEGAPTDLILKKVADIAADVLVTAARCDHKARVRELEEALLEARNTLDACAIEGIHAGAQVEAADVVLRGDKP